MNRQDAINWLKEKSMPIWCERGLDSRVGGFVENLSWEGVPMVGSRRCMVQSRQIYSFRTALSLGVIDDAMARTAVTSGIRALLELFSLPSGAFRQSIDEKGAPLDETAGLYGQAFVLFGLAEGYALLRDFKLVDRARELVHYLRRERRAPGGGYTEIEQGKVVFRSNPHMHLFEAALAWREIHQDPLWQDLSDELLELCLNRFIDSKSGLLGENFVSGWERERTGNGRFFWEPGHHCEWSWLLGRYQSIADSDLKEVRIRLFDLAELHGRDPSKGRALIDQVWSDHSPKLQSARFWPQCEHIKAASQLGREESAKEGMRALFRYLEAPIPGLWFDTWSENGQFLVQPVKASSLYHIIGAISEFNKI
jgi:mannose-6-phosphate isomerase